MAVFRHTPITPSVTMTVLSHALHNGSYGLDYNSVVHQQGMTNESRGQIMAFQSLYSVEHNDIINITIIIMHRKVTSHSLHIY